MSSWSPWREGATLQKPRFHRSSGSRRMRCRRWTCASTPRRTPGRRSSKGRSSGQQARCLRRPGSEQMPKSRREEVAALITMLALLEGVFFDTGDFRKLPYHYNLTSRALRSLVDSKVLMRIHDRRNYVLTDEFREMLKNEVKA